jgi:hypothetical protein
MKIKLKKAVEVVRFRRSRKRDGLSYYWMLMNAAALQPPAIAKVVEGILQAPYEDLPTVLQDFKWSYDKVHWYTSSSVDQLA